VNFLAHLYLAEPTPESAVGNLMPDFSRIRDLDSLDTAVRAGVLRHRAVDAFVDTHPAFLQARAMLRRSCNHFAPILVDLFNDHLLARSWGDWHEQPLAAFTTDCYRRLARGAYLMPARMRQPVAMMIEQDWLTSYESLDGLSQRLTQMSARFDRRFGRTFDVRVAVDAFIEGEDAWTRMFPGLMREVADHVASRARPA
jgi:acyl carrier protein phosphodiesterase